MADGALGDRAAGPDGRDAATAVFPGGSRGSWVRTFVGDRGRATLVSGSAAGGVSAREVPAQDTPAGAVAARAASRRDSRRPA